MSAIPPNWLASGIQALGAQRSAAEERDRDAVQQARARGAADPARNLIDGVESSDRDMQSDPDAEGAGSQGKSYSDEDAETEDEVRPDNPSDGGSSLDIQA